MSLAVLGKRLHRPALVLLALNAVVFAVFTLPRTLQERSLASRVALLRAEAERERGQAEASRRRAETIRENVKDAERFSREILKPREATLRASTSAARTTSAPRSRARASRASRSGCR
jgi:uncharacterized membrane protein YqiK